MEKKKRVRPTWALVRELEATVERQCEELRGWRKQCDELVKAKEKADAEAGKNLTELNLNLHNYVEKASYDKMKQAYEKLQRESEGEKRILLRGISELREKVDFYENRTFFERLFNIKPE